MPLQHYAYLLNFTSPMACFGRSNITFYSIKRPIHVILSVQIVYHRLRHPK